MSRDGKASFAALPVRAIGDTRLSALHLRVLACIAYHDRMSGVRGKGQGAWASNETLAARIGCHYTRLSSAVTELARLGYVEREPHPLNKKLRVYRVIYDAAADVLPDGKGSEPETLCQSANDRRDTVGEFAKNGGGTVCREASENEGIVCRAFGNRAEVQSLSPVEYISRSDERYSAEAEENTRLEDARAGARADVVQAENGLPSEVITLDSVREVRKALRAFKNTAPVGSMGELARRANIAQSAISLLLNQGKVPSAAALGRIAAALAAMTTEHRRAADHIEELAHLEMQLRRNPALLTRDQWRERLARAEKARDELPKGSVDRDRARTVSEDIIAIIEDVAPGEFSRRSYQ
jgi:DNA-binding MarR family transcriptional regulator/transcriptional regulator with XRE-family HTH domain